MLSFLYLTSYLQSKRSSATAHRERKNWVSETFGAVLKLIMSIQERFEAAVKVIRSLPPDGPYQPSNGTKLKFYSLFKQATEGPCKQSRPGFWDPVGRVKWESWNRLGDITSEQAMNTYIEELKKVCLNQISIRMPGLDPFNPSNNDQMLKQGLKIVETMSFNGDVQNFLESIGPFYEFINLSSPELDNVKVLIDKYTSSSSSSNSVTSSSAVPSPHNSFPSSPESSPQDTPAKEALQTTVPSILSADQTEIVTETTKTNHSYSNGHIPNQKSNQNLLGTVQLNPGMIPPPSPMHRPSHTGGSIDQLDNDDETIEVNSNNEISTIVVSHPTSAESSDQYFSGDSEAEIDQDQSDMVLMKPIIPTATYKVSSTTNEKSKQKEMSNDRAVRIFKTKHAANTVNNVTKTFDEHGYVVVQQRNKVDTVAILQGTVDRLNRDIDHVLARLRILEAAYAANPSGTTTILTNANNSNQSASKSRPIRPFRELSTSTWTLIFTWPIAVHFLIKLISWWIERRRRNRSRPLLSLS